MNLNLSRLCSEAKVNYFVLLCRCCIALFVCGIFLFPSVVTHSASGGGGSTRGGGAGRNKIITEGDLELKQGFIGNYGEGGLILNSTTAQHYSAYKRIDVLDFQKTAGEKGYYNVSSYFSKNYWISFYNWNGAQHTFLGSSPMLLGSSSVEIPSRTTYIIVNSSFSQTGNVSFVVSDDNSDSTLVTSFSKYENVWLVGMQIENSGKPNYFPRVPHPYLMSNYYWKTYDTHSITVGNTGQVRLYGKFALYDITYNFIKYINIDLAVGESKAYVINDSSAYYMKIDFNNDEWLTASQWSTKFTIQGLLDTEVYDTSYQIDNSGVSNIINNHGGSVKNYNIQGGDGSPIVIVDGDNNTITLPSANPIVSTPPNPVLLPGDSGSGEDDSEGGFFDIIGDLFGSIGNLLKGLMNIILTPVKLLVDTITELVTVATDTLASTVGMNDFFANLFGWLPPPIPGLLGLAIGSFIAIAIIKFLRG